MFLKRTDFSININLEDRLGIIEEESEDGGDEKFPDIERTPVKITKIEKSDNGIDLEWEEITEEEFHKIRHDGKYVDEIAEKVKDELDTKMLVKDAIADLDEETREKVNEALEEEDDVEVQNQSGCHELKIGDTTIPVRG